MTDMHMLHKMLNELYTEAHFEALLQMMDRLHDAAAMGELEAVCMMDTREVMGWLDDIIYTAEETVRELREQLNAGARREWSDN